MLSVERSGFYAWKKRIPSKRVKANNSLDNKIECLFGVHKGRYGAPRLYYELKDLGEICSKNRIARRLKFLGLRAKAKRKFRVTTNSSHSYQVFPNLLKRDFKATAPNQKWVGDITYVWTEEGWLYLAVVIDLFSRAVIGWSIQETMSRKLVCDALNMALLNRCYPKRVVFHSDRGIQYCSSDFQTILRRQEFECSMSRIGNCWDNAASESFFHTLKVELIHGNKYLNRSQAQQSIFEYIEAYYNRKRRHSAAKYLAPMVYEDRYVKVA